MTDRISPRPEGHPPPYPPRGNDPVETHTRRFNMAAYYPEAVPGARYYVKQTIRSRMFNALVESGIDPVRAEEVADTRITWSGTPYTLGGERCLYASLDVTFLGPDPNHSAHTSPTVGLQSDTQVTDTERVASPELATAPHAVG